MLSPEAQIAYFRSNNNLDVAPQPLEREGTDAPDSQQSTAPDSSRVAAAKSRTPARPGLYGRRAFSAPLVQQALRNDTVKSQSRFVNEKIKARAPSVCDGMAEDAFFRRYLDQDTQRPKQLFDAQLDPTSKNEEAEKVFPSHTVRVRTSITTGAAEWTSKLTEGQSIHHTGKRFVEANISVIGVGNVETTDFVRAAFDPIDPVLGYNSKVFTVDGVHYAVRLLEFAFEDIVIREGGFLRWPQTSGEILPHIHGAIIVYDAHSLASRCPVPSLTDGLLKADIQTVVVSSASTSDPRSPVPFLDVEYEKSNKTLDSEVQVLQASPSIPGSEQRCVEVLLHAVAFGSSALRTQSPSPRQSFHGKTPDTSHQRQSFYGETHNTSYPRYARYSQTPSTGPSLSSSDSSDSYGERTVSGSEAVIGISEVPRLTHPTLRRTSPMNFRQPPNLIIPESSEQRTIKMPELDQLALTFDELVDRLLTPPESKADIKFTTIFLAFYRMFAAPFQLLEAVVYRFDYMFDSQVDREANHPFLVRCLLLLDRWINTYPGDFAHQVTNSRLRRFLLHVMQDRTHAVAATQINLALEMVAHDDDTEWAYADVQYAWRDSVSNASRAETLTLANLSTSDTTTSSSTSDTDSQVMSNGNSTLTLTAIGPSRPRRSTVSSSQQSIPKSTTETAQRQAALLIPNPIYPFTKIQWTSFMAIPEEAIARELTRIDWVLFTSIKPRDLIRHVTVPTSKRASFPQLAHVTRMISHFNHIATWTTNVILARAKPKHRAQALDKCMRLARKLRELNNYDSLGAVVAGIHNSAVHRLHATRDLVSPAVRRDFLRLEMLMGTQKGSFAYRLAWENSPRERIPFLALHRGDLAVAEAGRDTFVGRAGAGAGDRRPCSPPAAAPMPSPTSAHSAPSFAPRINWRKFEAMGDVLLAVQRAQQTPYVGLAPNDEVRALVLDCVLVADDDDLYAWSRSLEAGGSFSSGAGAGDGSAVSEGGSSAGAGGMLKRSFDRWLVRNSLASGS